MHKNIFKLIINFVALILWITFQSNYMQDRFDAIFVNGQIKSDLLYYYFGLNQIITIVTVLIIISLIKNIIDLYELFFVKPIHHK